MRIVGFALAGAVGLGIAGFVFGARVPDERAGEIATMLGWGGVLAGAVIGAAVGYLTG